MHSTFSTRLLSLYGVLFFLFIYLPIGLIFVYSFNSNPINMMVWQSFTFDWYRTIFGFSAEVTEATLYVESTDQLIGAVQNSLIVASVAASLSTLLGTAAALALYRFRVRLEGFYRALMMTPMMMPDIVLGIALLIFFVSIGIDLGVTTIMIGHCTFLISYVFIIVSARLAGMDPSLEEASADLGATPFTTFRRITLPRILPGVMGGLMLAFIISMDDLVITYFISGVDATTLPVFILSMIRRGVKPEINAIASMLLMFSIIVASLGIYLRARSEKRL
ncbi:Spermidine Putrescine ABC transporter permease component potC [Marinobacterium lacunae]|uniref:Spermidine Putrescine ABC transporter permease component potC n=1 Tax=Marinobacterium lacunae TaxID=1232683 RepID=A0A081FY89_9GAMM|nr:ABC transporter permease [Marinobacterium lacunae]KEA63494.1 Spermidine Putrescine ABC transporter permease component potC [Marinobacterium lacunae]MBR9883954.1 ABC transporter permease [Oceanospirillales bacterium]